MDPASFSAVRLVTGSVVLLLFVMLRSQSKIRDQLDWQAALYLFAYMIGFSYAYVSLTTATGALILFGLVQLTMFVVGLLRGERFGTWAWVGFVMAIAGFVWLMLPGATTPNPMGAMLMAIAGIAWGLYSIRGQQAGDALCASAGNFLLAAPAAVLLVTFTMDNTQWSGAGLLLAMSSGALASGLGYVIWYMALRGLTAISAATVQLSVPVIAAAGGVLFLSEPISYRLVLASILTLTGVWLVLMQKRQA